MDGLYIDDKRFIKVSTPMVPRAMINMNTSTTSSSEGNISSNEKKKSIEAPPGNGHIYFFHTISMCYEQRTNTNIKMKQQCFVYHRPYSRKLTPMRLGCFKCTILIFFYKKEALSQVL